MTETNFDKALHVCMSLDMDDGDVPSPLDYVRALREAGLLAPDVQIIRTAEELETLTRDDADAVVLAGYVGVPRPACTLYEMHKAGQEWTLPAVVIASGARVRAAREAMEQDNE